MAFKSAEDMMSQGYNGIWYKPGSDFEKEVIIESIAGCNMVRGTTGRPALRHYERNGWIVIADNTSSEPHPDDVKK